MDTSGFFVAIIVFIGIFYIIIAGIIKDQMNKKKIDDQNSWKNNINNYPKHNR